MAQSEPMEKTADIGAMHDDAPPGEFHAQLVQRQLAIVCQALAHPVAMRIQFAATDMPLPSRRKRAGVALQDHQIVHETRRHPEMARGLPMAMALFDKRENTTPQRNRM